MRNGSRIMSLLRAATLPAIVLPVATGILAACGGTSTGASCGSGTHLSGSTCVAEDGDGGGGKDGGGRDAGGPRGPDGGKTGAKDAPMGDTATTPDGGGQASASVNVANPGDVYAHVVAESDAGCATGQMWKFGAFVQ